MFNNNPFHESLVRIFWEKIELEEESHLKRELHFFVGEDFWGSKCKNVADEVFHFEFIIDMHCGEFISEHSSMWNSVWNESRNSRKKNYLRVIQNLKFASKREIAYL